MMCDISHCELIALYNDMNHPKKAEKQHILSVSAIDVMLP